MFFASIESERHKNIHQLGETFFIGGVVVFIWIPAWFFFAILPTLISFNLIKSDLGGWTWLSLSWTLVLMYVIKRVGNKKNIILPQNNADPSDDFDPN